MQFALTQIVNADTGAARVTLVRSMGYVSPLYSWKRLISLGERICRAQGFTLRGTRQKFLGLTKIGLASGLLNHGCKDFLMNHGHRTECQDRRSAERRWSPCATCAISGRLAFMRTARPGVGSHHPRGSSKSNPRSSTICQAPANGSAQNRAGSVRRTPADGVLYRRRCQRCPRGSPRRSELRVPTGWGEMKRWLRGGHSLMEWTADVAEIVDCPV